MNISVSTLHALTSKTIKEAVAELNELNITNIELIHQYPHEFTNADIKDLKEFDITYSWHTPFMHNFGGHLDPAFRKFNKEIIKDSLDKAEKAEATHAVLHGGITPYTYLVTENPMKMNAILNEFIKDMQPLVKHATNAGVKVLLENETHKAITADPNDLAYIRNRIPELGFCWDIAHSEVTKTTDYLLELFKPDVVHLSDNLKDKDSHMALGKGSIDFRKHIAKLKNDGFNGDLVLEMLNMNDVKTSLELLKFILQNG